MYMSRRFGVTTIGGLDWRESIQELFAGVQFRLLDDVLGTDPDHHFDSHFLEN
jgi:hypothetical protein